MPELNDFIHKYYEDVPLEDDYLILEPELVKMDDEVRQDSTAKIVSEMAVGKRERKLDGDVLIVGAGISGMQAALDIADKGYRVIMVDKSSTVGGNMVKKDFIKAKDWEGLKQTVAEFVGEINKIKKELGLTADKF